MKIELIGFDFELNPNNKMDILVDAVNASDSDLILFPGHTIRDLNDLLYAEQDIKNKSSVAILELEESLSSSCLLQRNSLYMMHGGLFFDLYTSQIFETEEDIEDTLDVIDKVRFDGAFTFIYSKRSGTPAASMQDQVPEEVAKKYFARVLDKVQQMSCEMAARIEGTVCDVLVEEINRQDPQLVTGRLSNNLTVHFPGDSALIGRIVPVKLTECKGFYYLGDCVKGDGSF